jgi:hypothetical protein
VANQRVVKNYINGKSQESLSGQFTDLVNPTTGEVFGKKILILRITQQLKLLNLGKIPLQVKDQWRYGKSLMF